MIYQFRIISDEDKNFAREILINGDHTFLDFHRVLQKDLGYDPNQLASFFLTNNSWEKELQITLIDMMDEGSDTCITMDQATIADHVNTKEQRLLYVFDFFSDRAFFIELTEVFDKIESKALPKITFSRGDPPPQINLGLDDLSFPEEDESEINFGLDEEDLEEGFGISGPDDYGDA